MRIRALSVLLFLGPASSIAAQDGIVAGNWPSYGGDVGSTKYSALDQIDSANVASLEEAWRWLSPDNELGRAESLRAFGYKSTPIMVDGVLYISTNFGFVSAIDAASGEELWTFGTDSWKAGRPTNLGFNHRGVAYWTKGDKRRILMPANDAYLWSIDAATGTVDESFGDAGRIDLTQGLGREVPRRLYTVMSAPIVVGDIVVVGSSIFDGPTRKAMPPGHVRGFDAATGGQRWIFHSIPQDDEYGVETWEEESWHYSGNTNVWTVMSADPELGYVYLPFGTPTNDWYGGHRLGDNLFGESLVCLDAATGERVWHFQMVHHGLWDYDLPAAPNLIDIEVDGKKIRAVAQISKQGFIYVFDRVTGEPVWPIEERPVPKSTVPGERAAPTQPFPTKPAPYEHQGISDETLIDFTPELRAEAGEIISKYDHGPIFTPPSLRGTIQLPGWGGGANWTGAGVDPETGYIYIPSSTGPIVVQLVEPDPSRSDFRYSRGGDSRVAGPQGLPLIRPPYSRITAIDLNTGAHAWMVPHGDGIRQRIIDMGIPDPGPVGSRGSTGPVVTKTLLFFGQGGRTNRGQGGTGAVLRAFDKATGSVVATVELPAPPSGTPMTYMADGRQFLVVAVSGPESGLVALALPKS